MSIEQAYSSAEHLLEKRPYISDNDCYLIRLIQVLGNLKYHDIMIKKTCLLSLIRHAILIKCFPYRFVCNSVIVKHILTNYSTPLIPIACVQSILVMVTYNEWAYDLLRSNRVFRDILSLRLLQWDNKF
jgi:hypothetical protein